MHSTDHITYNIHIQFSLPLLKGSAQVISHRLNEKKSEKKNLLTAARRERSCCQSAR